MPHSFLHNGGLLLSANVRFASLVGLRESSHRYRMLLPFHSETSVRHW